MEESIIEKPRARVSFCSVKTATINTRSTFNTSKLHFNSYHTLLGKTKNKNSERIRGV
jgi:hypothetical protein